MIVTIYKESKTLSLLTPRDFPCNHVSTYLCSYLSGDQKNNIYKLPSFALDKISKNKYEKKEED